MILIGDIGSTSADWGLIGENVPATFFRTGGYNPVIHHTDRLHAMLTACSEQIGKDVSLDAMYYYGAGILGQNPENMLAPGIAEFFDVHNLAVRSDMLGAARAVCDDHPGVVCILGTGSNSCFYDGREIKNQFPGLGYPLGDEGSGWQIGAALVRDFYYDNLPSEVHILLKDALPDDRSLFLTDLKHRDNPNQYLAQFAGVVHALQNHPYIKKVVRRHFNQFIHHHLTRYDPQLQVHFVGSIAYFYRVILRSVLHDHAFRTGRIIQKPIEFLVQYHSRLQFPSS